MKNVTEMPQSNAPNPSDEFLNKDELAVRLKINIRTVEKWQQRGVLPFVKVGKIILFHWPDVVEHLRKHFRVLGQGQLSSNKGKNL